MVGIVFEGVIATGQDSFDTGILGLDVIESDGGGLHLVTSNGVNGGLSVFTLTTGGQPQLSDTQSYPSLAVDAVGGDLIFADFDGGPVVLAGDTGSGTFVGYAINANGTIGARQDFTLPETTADFAAALAVPQPDGSNILLTLDADSKKFVTYLDGDQTGLQKGKTHKTEIDTSGPVHLVYCELDGQGYVLVGDAGVQGVTAYSISGAKGELSMTDQYGLDQGLGANMPSGLTTVEAFGETWVLLSASASSSLSVLRLDPGGTLEQTDHVIDTLETRFDAVTDMQVFEAGGQVFVLAGGGDGGFSLFSLMPDGRLVYRDSMIHDTGLGLAGITAIEAVVTGDAVQIFVASSDSTGVAQFSLPLADLGVSIEDTGNLSGTDKADILCGVGDGSDRIDGKAGDDLLYAGDADTVLIGGGGADRFVLRAADAVYVIEDFKPGQDQLDLSLFPMLRSPLQLNFIGTQTGAEIHYGDTRIVITNANGGTLTTEQIWGHSFDWADRHYFEYGATQPAWGPQDAPPGTPPDLPDDPPPAPGSPAVPDAPDVEVTHTGTSGSDVVKGGEYVDDLMYLGQGSDDLWDRGGNNYVDGGDGADTLAANGGKDTIFGGTGGDSISGFDGNDYLSGQHGRDTIWGGTGKDVLIGGAGNDLIGGAEGHDTHYGGADNDTIYGGGGNDQGYGEGGNDQVWMSVGNDTAYGGIGDDSLGGGDDDDLIFGEDGDDLIYGGYQNDTLYGGEGSDVVWAGPGADFVFGDDGRDTVGGGEGRDVVYGGKGNDEVWGGTGDDFLYGGKGNDTLNGEGGIDAFVFVDDHGNDVINQFVVGDDYIYLDIDGLTYGDLQISNQGGDAVIETTGDNSITLTGLSANDLTEESFAFL